MQATFLRYCDGCCCKQASQHEGDPNDDEDLHFPLHDGPAAGTAGAGGVAACGASPGHGMQPFNLHHAGDGAGGAAGGPWGLSMADTPAG